MQNQFIVNPHLDGDPFHWIAGKTGILLIHGFTATTAEVRPLAKILHANGYSISAPLLPGHLTSPGDLNEVTWQDWTYEVEKYYQMLAGQCQQVYAGGESTGALLAIRLASMHPEISGILAYAPVLRLRLSFYQQVLLRIFSPLVPYIRKKNPESNEFWQGYRVNPLKGVIQLIKLQKEVTCKLPDVNQPILIVQGRLDKTVHPKSPKIIAENVNSSKVEIHWMETSSHTVILEHELKDVARTTIDFIVNSM